MWILALAAACDPINVRDHIVDDLSINTIHGFEGDVVTRFRGLLGHPSSELSQGRRPAGADPAHVDADLSLSRAATRSLQYCPNQFIYSLSCDTTSSYKKSNVFSVSFNPHNAILHVVPREREGDAKRIRNPPDESLREVGLLQERGPCVLIHH